MIKKGGGCAYCVPAGQSSMTISSRAFPVTLRQGFRDARRSSWADNSRRIFL